MINMRICVLMQEIQSLGGVQRVVTTMLNRLVELENCEVYILAPDYGKSEVLYPVKKEIHCVNDFTLRKKANFLQRAIKKVNSETAFLEKINAVDICDKLYFSESMIKGYVKFLTDNRITCIVGAGAYYSILAAKIAKRTNIKCIAWMHSSYESYFETPKHGTYGLRGVFLRYAPFMNHFFVLTKKDKDIFSKKVSTLKTEIEVLYNPLTLDVNRISTLNSKSILFVGRLSIEHKGIDRLIPIMQRVLSWDPDVKLEVVGDGGDKQYLIQEIKKNHLENSIKLVGLSNDVAKYYQNASVLLVTSRYEGFGLVITEALAHGVPVVAFNAYGPDEIIRNCKEGFLVTQDQIDEYADKVISLLSDIELRNSMSKNARERALDFSLDTIMKQFIKVLE